MSVAPDLGPACLPWVRLSLVSSGDTGSAPADAEDGTSEEEPRMKGAGDPVSPGSVDPSGGAGSVDGAEARQGAAAKSMLGGSTAAMDGAAACCSRFSSRPWKVWWKMSTPITPPTIAMSATFQIGNRSTKAPP